MKNCENCYYNCNYECTVRPMSPDYKPSIIPKGVAEYYRCMYHRDREDENYESILKRLVEDDGR